MYYYFKDSNEKILHLPHCYHLNQAKKKRISAFESITRAEEKGYRICKHCFGLKPYIKDEKENIDKICKDAGISCRYSLSVLDINTIYGQWKLYYNHVCDRLELYHANTFETGETSLFPNYHLQKTDYATITEHLNYIIQHDEYRHKNPLYIRQGTPKKPQKGTRAWHKMEQKNKQREKRKAIYNVLTLIDSLQTCHA